MRCRTSVGLWIVGSTSRTSAFEFIRIRSRAAAGLSAARPRRANHAVIAASAPGIIVEMSTFSPQSASSSSATATRSSHVGAHG